MPPAITTQPVKKSVTVGKTAKFTVKVSGDAPLIYQWRKNGSAITGGTASSYTTPATLASDDGSLFSVVVSNGGGSVTSNEAKLTVKTPPMITSQPADQSVSVGKTAKFTVTAGGTTPLSYQWHKNGTDISGATKASYTTPAVTTTDNGSSFSVTVTNSVGSVISNSAILTVN
ncbi:MAG: immunoglobulin domain-containing protein [Spartobacteria bacterium]